MLRSFPNGSCLDRDGIACIPTKCLRDVDSETMMDYTTSQVQFGGQWIAHREAVRVSHSRAGVAVVSVHLKDKVVVTFYNALTQI